jgi:hypothetical protein
MKYKLISCEVFARPAYKAAANSKNIIDMEFTAIRSHLKPDSLRKEIQGIIDRTPAQYDAILLGYGLCGNSTAGLFARSVPMVIPRAHDCCTVFLGGRKAYQEYFGPTPSAKWYTSCHYERSDEGFSNPVMGLLMPAQQGDYASLVEKYGEENAQYIWETLNAGNDLDLLTYVDLPQIPDNGSREAFLSYAAAEGKKTRILEGSTRLIDKLLDGEWENEEFLFIPPGKEIKPIYDHDRIMEV